MPELPEVETIARELQRVLPGRTVVRVQVFRANALDGRTPRRFEAAMTGRRFEAVTRRGKFLLFAMSAAAQDSEAQNPEVQHAEARHTEVQHLKAHLIGHLRMTGKFVVAPPPVPRPAHHRVWFHLEDGDVLAFQDMRCFGTLALVNNPEEYAPLSRVGMEPLGRGFTTAWLADALGKSRALLKPWLMDQGRIAGLGNIYVAEILHRAGLSPLRPANEVSRQEAATLHGATRKVLREAIRMNGTTISDFRRVDDKTGSFQNFLRVYDKAGGPCPRCKAEIVRIRQQQRSTYFCPGCQQ